MADKREGPPSWIEMNSHNKMFVFLFLLTRLPISCSLSWQVLQFNKNLQFIFITTLYFKVVFMI